VVLGSFVSSPSEVWGEDSTLLGNSEIRFRWRLHRKRISLFPNSDTEYLSFRCLSCIDVLSKDILLMEKPQHLIVYEAAQGLGCLKQRHKLPSGGRKLISVLPSVK